MRAERPHEIPEAAAEETERLSRALFEARRRGDRLSALQVVTARLSAVTTQAEAIEVVVQEGVAVLGATLGTIRLLSEDGQRLGHSEKTGFTAELEAASGTVTIDQQLPSAEAVRTRTPIWLATAEEWSRRFPAHAAPFIAAGQNAAAALPLMAREHTFGALVLGFDAPQAFDRQDREFMETMAEIATQALDRTRLYERERHRAEELAAFDAAGRALSGALEPAQLYQAIIEQAARVIPCSYASVLLYEDGWSVVAASLGEPGPMVGTRLFPLTGPGRRWLPEPIGVPSILADTALEPSWRDIPPRVGKYAARGAIALPLSVDGVLLGSFGLYSTEPNAYGLSHARLIVLFAERVEHALRNTRLYVAEKERARAAEALASLRSDFVASVSHELRTPLTAIIGFGELLQARWGQMSEEKRLERVGHIVQAANRQQRLVNDLLLASRLESAKLSPRCELLPLADLVGQSVVEVRGSYPGQPIVLLGPGDLLVHADPAHTVQILTNLLENAAKYSPEASAITVRWTSVDGMAVLRVIDNGSGVPADGREKLFTRFGRLPGSAIRSGRVGTGLGLFISRGLAEAMGGTLVLEATGSRGSTFQLRLPLPPAIPTVASSKHLHTVT